MNNDFKTYICGLSWFILSLAISAVNDVLGKYASLHLPILEVSFFRCLFSLLTLLPFVFYGGFSAIKTSRPLIQLLRGSLLFVGIACWIFGLALVPVSTATAVSFAIPLFVLVLAVFLLEEKIIWQRWVATIIGFVGIIMALGVNTASFDKRALIFVLAALAFATLDIINKKFVVKESMLSMLFYSALVTTILSLPLALISWKTPEPLTLLWLFLLGAGANLILFCLLKAFAKVDATAVAPYRYLELFISGVIAYLVFGELPNDNTLSGIALLIPTTLFIAYSENKRKASK